MGYILDKWDNKRDRILRWIENHGSLLELKKIIDFTLSNIHDFKKAMRERTKSK
jgi:hypothetical protein